MIETLDSNRTDYRLQTTGLGYSVQHGVPNGGPGARVLEWPRGMGDMGCRGDGERLELLDCRIP